MVVFSEVWIQLHIFQEIVHPAHVPFEGKAEAAILRAMGYFRPGRGLFGDNHCSVFPSVYDAVQMFEKFDCLQVFIIPVFVGDPLAVAASVIQIQHGGHGIHPEAVDMIVFKPVQSICNQEIGYFIFTVIKYLSTPVGMLPFSGIRIFIKRLSIEIGKAMGIFRKMSRYPVQNNADAFFVQIIDKIHEFLRCPVTGGRSEISGYLVSPGTIIGMLGDSHQFDMGVTHHFNIISQLMRRFHVSVITVFFLAVFLFPGTNMYFVDGHGRFYRIRFHSFFHP